MKTLVLEGRHKLIMQERPEPQPDGRKVIIKVNKCGICGGEFHFAYDTADSPPYQGMVLGHEYTGTVIDPGSRTDLKVGDRVVTAPNIGCGTCQSCRRGLSNLCTEFSMEWGAYAPFTAVSPEMVIPLPDDISFTEGAILEPVSTPTSAIRKLNVKNGDKVLVIGSGIIGRSSAVLAKHNGASFVAIQEVNMDRANDALNDGDCDAIFNGLDPDVLTKMREATNGQGFDAIVECSGSPHVMTSVLSIIRPGGSVALVGGADKDVPIPTILAVTGEIRMFGSYAYSREDFLRAMEMVRTRVIDASKYATKFISQDEIPQAFEELRAGKIRDVKVIIDYEK